MAVINLTYKGDLLVEAESLTLPPGSPWSPLTDDSASGLAMLRVASNFAPQLGTPTATSPGHLTLQLNVTTPGTYYLSLRGEATGRIAASDSVSVGLDGRPLTGSTGITGFGRGDQWTETPIALNIKTAGIHTVDIWAREPAFALDSLYIASSADIEAGRHQAVSVAAFHDSIGVNTHLTWLDSRYGDIAAVKSALSYTGVKNVRDTLSLATGGPRFDQLGDMGIKLDWLMSPNAPEAPSGQSLEWGLQQIRTHAWMTRSIEGPNEVDFWPVARNGLTGTDGANAFQRDLYTQVKADPLLARFPVLQHTLGDYANYPGQRDMSAYADYGNTHAYTGDADPPGINVPVAIRAQEPLNGADPVITTESGYGTSIAQSYGRVTELAQAKYIPMLFAEQYAQGVKATYLYQLFDPYAGADPTKDFFNYYGLFRTDGTPKPAATALKHMSQWLSDSAQPFTPGTLDYSLRGAPDSVGNMLLQKSNGTFVLMLWNDVRTFNSDTGGDITNAPVHVELKFKGTPTNLLLRDTLVGTSTTLTASQQVALDIPDHLVMLEIQGVGGSTGPVMNVPPAVTAPPGPAPLSNSVGLGSDTLVLRLSQDYFQGSAQYTVKVDGVQAGGTQVARAFHSDSKSDTLTIHGEWGVGSHTVTVALMNDLWGGSASADRNLYLDGATYNGTAVAGASLGKVSTANFAVVDNTIRTPMPKTVTIGTGTDFLTLKLSQDAWQGDAQYTISVDGVQYGGVQTVAAYHSTGQVDTVTVKGDWVLGPHNVTLRYTNDAYGGAPNADRNLYLMGATYNGVAVGGSSLGMVGTTTFSVQDVAPAPISRTLGSGSDSLVLKLSQDAWGQNALYIISVDGVQIGGAQTASAYHAVNQSDTITVKGDWALGVHTVAVTLLNDASGSSARQDRNLYLNDASYNGVHVPTTYGSISNAVFQVTDVPPAPKSTTIGVGLDSLVLKISQDAWQGDAQYMVTFDGVQQGGVQTAAAYHSIGKTDTITLRGDWALGQHRVGINFLNDVGGSTTSGDRNLYLESATYNGASVGTSVVGKLTTANFDIKDIAPSPAILTLGSGPDSLVLKVSQDAWQARSQYSVTVDGVPIGGTQTVSAYHAAGQSDTVTIKGNWGVGHHSVKVTFLNDAYDGSATRDRNLYLDAVSYDGRQVDTYTGNIGTHVFTVTDTGVWG